MIPNSSHMLNTPPVRQNTSRIWEMILAILWIIIIPFDVAHLEILKPVVSLLILLSILYHWRYMLDIIPKLWFLFLLPGICFLSILWSNLPIESLKFGFYMLSTVLICIYTAARLSYLQFLICLLISSALLISFSLMMPTIETLGDGTVAAKGVFTHKNTLGTRCILLMMVCVSFLIMEKIDLKWKVLSAIMIPCTLVLIFLSKSATAILLSIGGVLVILTVGGVWLRAARIKGLQGLLFTLGFIIIGSGGLMIANVIQIDPVTTILDSVQKDQTLTGRTEIWKMADKLIERKPLLGVGAKAFWHPSVSEATILSRRFYAENNQFYFHNAFYEVIVHIGYVGLSIFTAVNAFLFWCVFRAWQKIRFAPEGFSIALLSVIFIRMFVESELFSAFLFLPMVYLVISIQSFLSLKRKTR